MQTLTGKRLLITHTIVHGLMGSTVTALELATHLSDQGASVTVYASFVSEPAAGLFRARGIELVDDTGIAGISLSAFDYIWVHSQVLPVALVEQLGAPLPSPMPAFIFLHMSALEYVPDEHPYIPGLEDRLSALTLFVAPETRDKLMPFLSDDLATGLFPNPTPAAFTRVHHRPNRHLRRVAVVSNHPVPEVVAAGEELRHRGTAVDYIGAPHGRVELVTPELLGGYDAVMTIGKTVQYCLVGGIPVYVYDRHGGFGYLSADTLEAAAYSNFSGRGGTRRSGAQIAASIVEGHEAAARYQMDQRQAFISRFSLENVLADILPEPGNRNRCVDPLPEAYLHSLRSAQLFGARFYRVWGERDQIAAAHHRHANRLRHVEERAFHAAQELREREATWLHRIAGRFRGR